ncbi:SGNH/GDSL hydrolase family protein [Streptomyces sp. ODS28]|uniref:SGNH/GDSL hydrolase family protein n=1 Tax=Streptomyces sp. ODS28 TaxID=3136688 RepID=UPI0031E77B04
MRAAVAGSVLAVIAGGIGLAAACGDPSGPGGAGTGSGGEGGQRTPGTARPSAPSAPPSASPSPSRAAGWAGGTSSLAAVGDSITRGFDACSLLSDCTRASWATGTQRGVRSLAQRLLDDPAGRGWNHAVSGAVMADLPGQVERAARRNPDLVTVLSGANDACRPTVGEMTSVEAYREDFRKALGTLWKERPRTRVYVASVPNLLRLWEQGRSNPRAVQMWDLGICPSMLRDARSEDPADQQRRAQVQQRVMAYNRVLQEECGRHERCRYDGGAVFGYRFTTAELSRWDWFHPSQEGQRKLAEIAYERITARR